VAADLIALPGQGDDHIPARSQTDLGSATNGNQPTTRNERFGRGCLAMQREALNNLDRRLPPRREDGLAYEPQAPEPDFRKRRPAAARLIPENDPSDPDWSALCESLAISLIPVREIPRVLRTLVANLGGTHTLSRLRFRDNPDRYRRVRSQRTKA
jgi:hypothetical protein